MPHTPDPPEPTRPALGDEPPGDASRDADGPDGVPAEASAGRRLGDPVDEPRVPRGCHPLVFGVVMATIQFAVTIYFMQRC